MKFGPVSLPAAEGKILGHNIVGPDGRRLLRKGKALTRDDLQRIRESGLEAVYVAELDSTDLDENSAAVRIAAGLSGPNLKAGPSKHGRVNLYAAQDGLLDINVDRLAEINSREGVAVATGWHQAPVRTEHKVATIKVIPYALPESEVADFEERVRLSGPVVSVRPYLDLPVSMIYAGSDAAGERFRTDFKAVFSRLESLRVEAPRVCCVRLEHQNTAALTERIAQEASLGAGLILLASDTAIMDRMDVLPRALADAGGRIETIGAPVDPGNLFMLGSIGRAAVLGIPGCARSKQMNIIDLILPRLLTGESITRAEIVRLGHGGLLA